MKMGAQWLICHQCSEVFLRPVRADGTAWCPVCQRHKPVQNAGEAMQELRTRHSRLGKLMVFILQHGALPLMLVLILATGVQAQQRCRPCERNFPHLNDPRANGVAHDAGHALTSVIVYEGLSLINLPRSPLVRMVIATVGVPLVQETVDAIQYPRYSFGSLDSLHDWLTYQGAWSLYFAEDGQWGWAAATLVAYAGVLYAWNYAYKGDWGVNVRLTVTY